MKTGFLALLFTSLTFPAVAFLPPDGLEIGDESDILSLVEEGIIDPSTADQLIKMMNDPLDLLSASPEEMIDVPGIGPEDVERIIELRKRGKLRRIDDLRLIGIKRERIELIKRFSRVSYGKSKGWIGLKLNRRWDGEVKAELSGKTSFERATCGSRIRIDRDGCRVEFFNVGWISERFSAIVGDYAVGGKLEPFRIRPALSSYRRERGAALFLKTSRFMLLTCFSPGKHADAIVGSAITPVLFLGLAVEGKRASPSFWLWRARVFRLRVSQKGIELEVESRDKAGRAWLSIGENSLKIHTSSRLSDRPRVYASCYLKRDRDRIYLRGYASFGTNRFFGGTSFYRYLRGVPSVEYASRSFTCWAGLTVRGATLKLKYNLYRRGGPKPHLKTRVVPEIKLRLPRNVAIRARISSDDGWRVTISRWGSSISGYAMTSDDAIKGRVEMRWGRYPF